MHRVCAAIFRPERLGRGTLFAAIGTLSILSGCGNSSDVSAAPPSTCDLANVSPGQAIRYELIVAREGEPPKRGSTIAQRNPVVEREFGPPQTLSGYIDFVPISPLPDGTRLAMRLVYFELHGGGLDLVWGPPGANGGEITASSAAPYEVSYSLAFADYHFSGTNLRGSLSEDCPPTFSDLDLSGGTTTSHLLALLHLVARPD